MRENYNLDWWRLDQEPKCRFMHLTKSNPWYRCTTRQKLAQDPETGLYYDEYGDSRAMKDCIIHHYECLGYTIRIRTATRTGFLPAGAYGVMPYMGQWGRGWIIATGLSASSVNYTYLLVE